MKHLSAIVLLILPLFIACSSIDGYIGSMVYPRSYSAFSCVNKKIVVTGGSSFGKYLNKVEVYNMVTKKWSFMKDTLYGRSHHGSIIFDGEILLTGGRGRKGAMDKNEMTSSLSSWKEVAPLNVPRYSHNTFTLGGDVYVSGGYGRRHTPLKSTERYDYVNNRWVVVSDMLYESANSRIIKVTDPSIVKGICSRYGLNSDELIISIGGVRGVSKNNTYASDKVQIYSYSDDKWLEINELLYPRSKHTANLVNGVIYVAGGVESDVMLEVLDLSSDRGWRVASVSDKIKHSHTSEVKNSVIYLIGGKDGDGKPTNTVLSYDTSLKKFLEIPRMVNPRYDHFSVLNDEILYVFGGLSEFPLTSIDLFNFKTDEWVSSYQENLTIDSSDKKNAHNNKKDES